MNSISKKIQEKPWLGWVLFLSTLVVVFLLGLFASEVVERRAEAVFAYNPSRDIDKFEPRNAVWGTEFPRQYQSWAATEDTSFYSKHNNNAGDDMLAKNPNMVVLWAGYGFSKDYNSPRGHIYAVKDIHETLRTGAPEHDHDGPMPSTCWTCKSPDVPRLMNEIGVAEFYEGKWASKGKEIVNPIGCADCHDSETMNLAISRPALIEGFEMMGQDISKATPQEMRSLVCAQCHVEYYFDKDKGKGNYLTFPWKNGTKVEDMEKYFDDIAFSDWTHSISKAPMLKAQHPGYELSKEGIHEQRGVSCADCHMPYKSEGGVKYTDHHIQSPLANPANSCQVCHREEAEELKKNVYDRQDAIKSIQKVVEYELVRAHFEAGKAWELGATKEQMKDILTDIRHAQWRWDFSVASHGGSFHAPLEVSRIMSTSLERSQNARRSLAILLKDLGFHGEVEIPDISTKDKAQKAIGFDVEKAQQEKDEFIKNVVPKWIKEANKRQSEYQPQITGKNQIPKIS
ncbi:ammonia-forming cytochrome c nitrite reductase [Aureibacter tunicatorum]|uniref:Cytochrome c-552 n=1 Tax=Aureibacter tunicatorum TaxID=866807 RepID=A0AAE3XNJ3_9BACT|nr:ammonia-forming cytochrome c nitrite reductase [Aureibacter tunicatorum]MDR6239228.1 nitrite reductase (cytochrome c-552) [Aureibacter tunicatorum]BDD04847.1 cytochrome c-552 [Aureibacter tunicatorum]